MAQSQNEFGRLIRFRGRPKQHYLPESVGRGLTRRPYVATRPSGTRFISPQRVTVKVHYKPPQKLAAHLKYIERDGAGRKGGAPELFTQDGEEPRLEAIPGEPRYFSVILAPENGEQLDMKEFTRTFMHRIEDSRPDLSDSGSTRAAPLVWSAAVHYNTDHPHAHIVIRGLDKAGTEVVFPRSFISHHMRETAIEIATRELGPRSREEIQNQRQAELTSDRYTFLDRRIAKEVDPATQEVSPSDSYLKRRLDHLVTLSEAEVVTAGTYRLSRGWERSLRKRAEQGDILKTIYADLKDREESIQRVYPYNRSWNISGTVVSKGLDDGRDEPYALIRSGPQTAHSRHYYYRAPDADQVSLGDRVSITHGKLLMHEQSLHHDHLRHEKRVHAQAVSSQTAPDRSQVNRTGEELSL